MASPKLSNPDIVKFGALQKRSQNKGRFTAENYKRRFFVLSKYYFKYYDGNSEKLGKKKGEIALRSVKVVENVGERMLEGKENAFQVVYEEHGGYYTLYMVAQNAPERQDWVDAIRKESVRQNCRFLEKYHKGVWTKSLGKFNCCDQVDRSAVGCVISNYDRQGLVGKNDRQTYIAIYDYEPVEEGDLELCKGDQYDILDSSREHWWLAKNTQGQKGFIPSNYVKKKYDLEIYDWYYKDLSRTESESILRQSGREGCFLVRDSVSTPGEFSLSLYTQESGIQVRHYHIKRSQESYFYIAEHHSFASIPELITYHRHNAGGLVTRLKEPPQRNTKPTTAGFGHSQFEIDPKYLTIGEQLGAGCFGSVHKGLFKGMPVAVKRMKENTMSEESFKEEAKTMTQLSHKNLVQLYGVVTKKRPMCIVTELMRNGALNNYLKHYRSRLIYQTPRLLDFCIQVCQGMDYLESRKFIHRDLAARNCLVGENSVIKVADFGLARYVLDDEYQSSVGTKFPVKWAPPEVLQYTRFSSKSDVWAFGILMWEVFTCGEMPYGDKRNIDVVEYVVTENKRLSRPSIATAKTYQIMMRCWEKNPNLRPSFEDLLRQLSELNRDGDYPHVE